jgi:hypothetical protein
MDTLLIVGPNAPIKSEKEENQRPLHHAPPWIMRWGSSGATAALTAP